MTSIEQPFGQPTISVTDSAFYPPQALPLPFAQDNLGEDNYGTTGGTPDRHIDDQEAHPAFYGLGDMPQAYPL